MQSYLLHCDDTTDEYDLYDEMISTNNEGLKVFSFNFPSLENNPLLNKK